MLVIEVASAVILRYDDKVLCDKRKMTDVFPGQWEFPGGKLEPGEDPVAGLKREVEEELGLKISVHPRPLLVCAFDRPLTVRSFNVSLYLCRLTPENQTPQLLECDAVDWFTWHAIPLNCMPSLMVWNMYMEVCGGMNALQEFDK